MEKINQWITLSANLGVLIGIFAILIEINQNTRAIENEAIWARTVSSENNQRYFIENPESLEWLIRFANDPEEFEQLLANDDLEAWRARAWARMLHLNYQARYQTLDSEAQREQLLEIIRDTYNRFQFIVPAIKSLGFNIWDEDFRLALVQVIDEYE